MIRYKRYAVFTFNYLFKERIRGLDFTLRDRHLLYNSDNKLYGYSITPGSHLKEVFETLFLDQAANPNEVPQNYRRNFIDVGCGKGYVLWQASKYQFNKICGIDIDNNLIGIANKNMRKLKLTNVEALHRDALKYDLYGEYDYFFFYNPFSIEIFKPVFDKIILSLADNPRLITIIYYHPTCGNYIESTGVFEKKYELYDKVKDYKTYVYVNELVGK